MRTPPNRFTLNAFEEALQQALKLFDQPERLGYESPLAAPYFLWHALRFQPNATSQKLRGETLRHEITQAALQLWGDGPLTSAAELNAALQKELGNKESPRYAYLLLELQYFQQHLAPRTPAAIYDDLLHISKASFYRSLTQAIQQLGNALLLRLQPTLRIEQPFQNATLIGYQTQFEQCYGALQAGQSVALIGPGGVGKTTLATKVAQSLADHPLFWFTFRNSLTDHLDSLLMALGHFFVEQGATATWQFLLASGGKVENYHLASALVQQDLTTLRPKQPILCFDEADILRSDALDLAQPAYTQLLEFLESIRQSAALLLIGQRPILSCDNTIQLPGLAAVQVESLLLSAGLSLLADEIVQLTRYSLGNPRLLLLFVAIHQPGDSVTVTLNHLPHTPELGMMLERLWRKLGTNERRLLQQLAVFRSYAPLDNWARDEEIVQTLLGLRLLQQDGQGGVQLLPVLRQWIYGEMSQTEREQHHFAAAFVRQLRAEYTAAAYHFQQANYSAQAIQVWYPQSELEIQRGQADAARAVFLHLSIRGLAEAEQDAWREICARLHQLRGENESGLAIVEPVTNQPQQLSASSEQKVRLKILRGRFLGALGQPHQALESYADAINISAHLLQQMNLASYLRSRIYEDQREFAKAWREADRMEYQLYKLQGQLHCEAGHYGDAQIAFEKALQLAEKLQAEEEIAKIHLEFSVLFTFMFETAKAIEHVRTALVYFERVKDLALVAICQNNLATAYMNAGDHQAAIEPLRKALLHCQQAKDSLGIASATSNLAECFFEVGDSVQAEQYAYQSIDAEESNQIPYAYYTLGRVQWRSTQYLQAREYFHEGIRIAQRNQDTYIEAFLWQELGTSLFGQEESKEAGDALRKAVRLFAKLGITGKLEETQTLLDRLPS